MATPTALRKTLGKPRAAREEEERRGKRRVRTGVAAGGVGGAFPNVVQGKAHLRPKGKALTLRMEKRGTAITP